MKTLLTIIAIIAALLFVALFVAAAVIAHDFRSDIEKDEYLRDLYEGDGKGGEDED